MSIANYRLNDPVSASGLDNQIIKARGWIIQSTLIIP